MNKLVVDLLQQKGLGCWKVLKKGCFQKGECFFSSQTRWSCQIKRACASFWTCSSLPGHWSHTRETSSSLNFQSMRTQAESTYIAHNMFGQVKMKLPWYNSRHTLIPWKRGGKPRMTSGQFVVVRVGVHQLSVSPNTSLLCFKSAVNSCMVIACPVWTVRTYNHTHADPEKRSAIELSSRHLNEAVNWDQPKLPSANCHYW